MITKEDVLIECQLNLTELEKIVNALAHQPYIEVAVLIEKLQSLAASKITELKNTQMQSDEGQTERQ